MADITESIEMGMDTLNGLDWYFQVRICIGASALAIYCLRRFVRRQIAELVNDTEVGWDNDLYIALESKINIFFVFATLGMKRCLFGVLLGRARKAFFFYASI